MFVPNYQTSTLTGNVEVIPVSATQTTVGTTYIPPAPSSPYPLQAENGSVGNQPGDPTQSVTRLL
jgi:hypothetical protein